MYIERMKWLVALSFLLGCRGEEVSAAATDAASADTPPGIDASTAFWPRESLVESPGCGTFPGPRMARIEAASAFCIDTTEVTNEQYNFYLASSAKPMLPKWCVKPAGAAGPAPVLEVALRNRPRAEVDWCDAWLYCAWAGKRLCGKIGGGRTSYADFKESAASQWSWVCGNGAANSPYPYGNSPKTDDQGCRTQGGSVVDVGSHDKCTGTSAPYNQVFDMVGNAGEWEDSCSGYEGTTPSTRTCRGRGGWTGLTEPIDCDYDQVHEAAFKAADLSFRCCVDLPK